MHLCAGVDKTDSAGALKHLLPANYALILSPSPA